MSRREEEESLMKSKKDKDQDPDDPDDSHCFPYYDFFRSLYRRFEGSFVTILIIENLNFGLWMMVQLASQDLFKAYMD